VTRHFIFPSRLTQLKREIIVTSCSEAKLFNFERLQVARKHNDPKLISAYGTAETEVKNSSKFFALRSGLL
jgi:hypothetical protein